MRRRDFLVSAALAALPAHLRAAAITAPEEQPDHNPQYRALQPFIDAGRDVFSCENEAMRLRALLQSAFQSGSLPVVGSLRAVSPHPQNYANIAPDLKLAQYAAEETDLAAAWPEWCHSLGKVRRIDFYPLPNGNVRYEVASEQDGRVFYRVGLWNIQMQAERISAFSPKEEHLASAARPFFRDITCHALEQAPDARAQLARGIPYWRSHLDPASGIDIYGSNGIAVGDIDGDGQDEIYVCQPGGLPNRLLKFRPDGTLEDLTQRWGAGLLDDTSAALLLDMRNSGRQDLVVLRSGGPVLLLNEGQHFKLRDDAFRFARQPLGGFTGIAAADFDRDGRLDLYLCCYVYFQSEAQFTYPTPYHDAQNGPPNFLFRNRLNSDGTGFFEDCTAETGIDENNNRFSFAPSWCDFNGDGWPDLYVANDFGRNNLYVNRDGHFRDEARRAGVEDIGPGMSSSWFDYDCDGLPDLYVANMWSDAGQRVIEDPQFRPAQASTDTREAYHQHTNGNSLYRNRGNGSFENVSVQEHAQFGRWAWSSCGFDLDNDGEPEIAGTCGMLSNASKVDLMSFFWRQVVAKSPASAEASLPYQQGWNAINQFIREEYSWNGHEPNVMHVRRGGRFFDFSGVSGLDFTQDGRAYAITDFDGDGRPDILLKSRLGPQLRVLQNDCAEAHHSLAIQLEGTRSNRDAIGARVRVDGQTKWLEAGSGFLSQHTKRLLFGLRDSTEAHHIEVLWPSGIRQQFGPFRAGFAYFLKEGSTAVRSTPFRAHTSIASAVEGGHNELSLADTWLLEPLPLPELQSGPALLILSDGKQRSILPEVPHRVVDVSTAGPDRRRHYEIFRRYLFDYRAQLVTPFAMLLNQDGHVVKVYGAVPTAAQVRSDLSQIGRHGSLGLPYRGQYVVAPRRDFAKFGIAYLLSGYPDQALPYLEAVLRRAPENARILVLVGQIHLDAHRFTEAETNFRRALAAGRPTPEALYGMGTALSRQNRLSEAQTYFQQAIQARPNYADAINDLGTLFIQQGKVDDAISAYRYGIQVAPDEDILYLNLGRAFTQLGQFDRARQVMQELLDRKPNSATARHALQELSGR